MQSTRGIKEESYSKGKWLGFTRLCRHKGAQKDYDEARFPVHIPFSLNPQRAHNSEKYQILLFLPTSITQQTCLSSLPGHLSGNPPVMSSLGVMCIRVYTVLVKSIVRNKSVGNCFNTRSSTGAKLTFSRVEASLCDVLCTCSSTVSLIKSSHKPDWSRLFDESADVQKFVQFMELRLNHWMLSVVLKRTCSQGILLSYSKFQLRGFYTLLCLGYVYEQHYSPVTIISGYKTEPFVRMLSGPR